MTVYDLQHVCAILGGHTGGSAPAWHNVGQQVKRAMQNALRTETDKKRRVLVRQQRRQFSRHTLTEGGQYVH